MIGLNIALSVKMFKRQKNLFSNYDVGAIQLLRHVKIAFFDPPTPNHHVLSHV